MNDTGEARQKQPAPEQPRKNEQRQAKLEDTRQAPLDEQSLDDVLRDCPL